MSSAAETPSPSLSVRPALVIAALGVVFGDIGTSPLYAFRVALGAAGHDILHSRYLVSSFCAFAKAYASPVKVPRTI